MLRRAVDELRPAITIELDYMWPTQAADAAMRVERDRPVARSQRHQCGTHSLARDVVSSAKALRYGGILTPSCIKVNRRPGCRFNSALDPSDNLIKQVARIVGSNIDVASQWLEMN